MKEYRCPSDKSLLCKASGEGQLEIKNQKTRFVAYTGPSRKHQDTGLKGIEFQQKSVDLKCSKCNRLLARAIGIDMNVEIKCRHCKELSTFSLAEMQKGRFSQLSKIQLERIVKDKKEGFYTRTRYSWLEQ